MNENAARRAQSSPDLQNDRRIRQYHHPVGGLDGEMAAAARHQRAIERLRKVRTAERAVSTSHSRRSTGRLNLHIQNRQHKEASTRRAAKHRALDIPPQHAVESFYHGLVNSMSLKATVDPNYAWSTRPGTAPAPSLPASSHSVSNEEFLEVTKHPPRNPGRPSALSLARLIESCRETSTDLRYLMRTNAEVRRSHPNLPDMRQEEHERRQTRPSSSQERPFSRQSLRAQDGFFSFERQKTAVEQKYAQKSNISSWTLSPETLQARTQGPIKLSPFQPKIAPRKAPALPIQVFDDEYDSLNDGFADESLLEDCERANALVIKTIQTS